MQFEVLRSLPSVWHVVATMIRGQPGLDQLDFDDLYNNLKVYEHELKGVSNSNSQNIAFLSTEVKGSTLKQSTAEPAHIPKGYTQAISSKVILLENVDLLQYQEKQSKWLNEKRIVAIEEFKLKSLVLNHLIFNKSGGLAIYMKEPSNTPKLINLRENRVQGTEDQFGNNHPKDVVNNSNFSRNSSGCSGSMTGDKDKLSDFKEFKGGYVAFGNDSKGGRISGKGTIKTSCLDFEKVSYVEEKMFKFVDEDLVILRAPRKNDVYSLGSIRIYSLWWIHLFGCKATEDEAVLWHRRPGGMSNFKNIQHSSQKKDICWGYATKQAGFRVYNRSQERFQGCLHVNFLGESGESKGEKVLIGYSDDDNQKEVCICLRLITNNRVGLSGGTGGVCVDGVNAKKEWLQDSTSNQHQADCCSFIYKQIELTQSSANMLVALFRYTRGTQEESLSSLYRMKVGLKRMRMSRVSWSSGERAGLLIMLYKRDTDRGISDLSICWMSQKCIICLCYIKEEVYVKQHPGFEDYCSSNKVFRVVKALYGPASSPQEHGMKDFHFSFEGVGYRIGALIKLCLLSRIEVDIMLDRTLRQQSTPIEALKSLGKDEEDFQVSSKVSHLHACQKIFSFLDSDYAEGDNHDRRFPTSGGCQYLGEDLVILAMLKKPNYCGYLLYRKQKYVALQVVVLSKVAGKKILISEATIRADLLFDDENGVDCFPKQVIWDVLRDIGYEGNLAQLTFSKPLFSPQWKYLVLPTTKNLIFLDDLTGMLGRIQMLATAFAAGGEPRIVLILGLASSCKGCSRFSNSKCCLSHRTASVQKGTAAFHSTVLSRYCEITGSDDFSSKATKKEHRSSGLQSNWGGIRMRKLCLNVHNVQVRDTAHPFLMILLFDQDVAVTPDLERKQRIGFGDNSKYCRPRRYYYSMALNLKDEAGPSSPSNPIQVMDAEDQLKEHIEVLVLYLQSRGFEFLVPYNSTSTATHGSDPKDKGIRETGLKNLKKEERKREERKGRVEERDAKEMQKTLRKRKLQYPEEQPSKRKHKSAYARDRRYPLSRELMIRMLEHGMEVEDESETAITLIHLFILWTTANGDNS
ncbi:hypothetical protein Tco_1109802 [Tanacetum coccineum]|uniref:Uncharacterized protein n=1 Tax=Tanacetum coccineum TaxID=301880 RepID=A0ABQ5IH93_9ASTR